MMLADDTAKGVISLTALHEKGQDSAGPSMDEMRIVRGDRDEYTDAMICAALVKHLAAGLKEEYEKDKNERKAREERALRRGK